MNEIEYCQKISELQDSLIDALSKRVDNLIKIKELRKKIEVLNQIDDMSSESRSTPPPEGVPRRACIWLNVPAEKIIMKAIYEVEVMGADPILTEVVIRLGKAKDLLSNFVDKNKT